MAVPNSNFTEILSTTLHAYGEELVDNILNNNVLLARLNRRGKVRPVSGGATILENLMYAENGNVLWYSGYETLNTAYNDTLTSAQYDWKQLSANVTMSGLEELQNRGKEAIHNLVKARIEVAELSLQNTMGAALFYSNTENGGKAIGGLQHLVADLPTSGTVGGIDTAAQTWWANQYYDFSAQSVTASATTMLHAVNTAHLACVVGQDKPDLAVAGSTYFNYFEEALQPQQRFTTAGEAEAGFSSYKYKGMDVVYDSNCAATRFYLLNTKYLALRPGEGRNFVQLDRKMAVNQDAVVIPLYWAGGFTCSNRSRQAVIVA